MSPDSTTQSKTLTGFNGLWSRGLGESCPPDHLQQCQNCTFPGPNQVSIREPLTPYLSTTISNLISFAIATLAQGPVVLGLFDDGSFWDVTNNRVLSGVGAIFPGGGPFPDDFIAFNTYGRVYISFKLKGKAMPNTSLYYYQIMATYPYYRFTLAGGEGPTSVATLANGSSSGPLITAGVHCVGVCFQTETGFLTPPTSYIATIDADGLHQIAVTNIPISPAANVVARVLLMSQANQTELFFVPGGTINDNTTTTATINVADNSLIASADYLNDIAWRIPACSSIRLYKGRFILIGPNGVAEMPPSGSIIYNYPDNVLVSNQLSPETFNMVTGIVNLPVDYGNNNTNTGAIIRDILYCMKPYGGTYAIQDNGSDPSAWPVTVIDSGLGTYDSGLSIFESSVSAQDILDQCLVVSPRGLLLFNGAYQDPPLSYKIESLWQTIDVSKLNEIKLAHDPKTKRLYVFIPASGSPDGSYMQFLMCDYTEGLGPTTVKWSVWNSELMYNSAVTKMLASSEVPLSHSNPQWQLILCGAEASSGLSKQLYVFNPQASAYYNPSSYSVVESPIKQVIQTANVNYGQGINIYTLLDFSVVGIGPLNITLVSKKGDITANISGFTLTDYNSRFSPDTATSGMELYRGINFQSEAMSVSLKSEFTFVDPKYSAANLTAFFHLSSITVYGKLMYKTRPALVQTK